METTTRGQKRITLTTRLPDQKIALRGVRFRSAVAALAERTTVEQTFVNEESVAIEAVYTFPLPEDAAVCGFEVITGDRVLTGVVEENEKAIEKYDAAIDRGDAAYLLEQERPDVFTIRVGNINPKQAATIRLTYVRAVKVVDRQIRLAYPTTIAPRYVPAASAAPDPVEAQIDGDALNPPKAAHVPYGLSIDIEIDLGPGVKEIASPTHAVVVRREEDERRRITFAGGIEQMDRDLIIDVRMAKEQKPSVVCVGGGPNRGNDHFMAVTFMPEFDLSKGGDLPPPSETVFVLDCSGSMQGESIAQATAALELCLRSLNEGDTFNICRFGSRFEMFRSEPVRYDARTLHEALQYIRRGADLGGTEILKPLQEIFKNPPAVGSVRNVIVLTDGQVSTEPDVIELARKHRVANRIFSFGIGTAASAHLVNGLARGTGGAAEFITGNERVDEKVLRAFGRMASPMVSDVRIDWGGSDVQTLSEIPPLFDGDAVAIYARVLGTPPKEVTLRCKLPDGRETSWTLPTGHPIPDAAGIVPTMWARRAIQSFEEVNGVRRTSALLKDQGRDRQRLLAISKDFNLVCSLTGFIAVEHRSIEERNEGRPALRRVPVTLARGWGGAVEQMRGGVGGFAGGAVAMRCLSAMPASDPGKMRKVRARHFTRVDDIDKCVGDIGGGPDEGLDRTLDRSLDLLRDSQDTAPAGHVEDPAEKMLCQILEHGVQAGARQIELVPATERFTVFLVVGEQRRAAEFLPVQLATALTQLIREWSRIELGQSAGELAAEIDGVRVSLPVTLDGSAPPEMQTIRIDLSAVPGGVVATIKRALHARSVMLIPPGQGLLELLSQQTAEGALPIVHSPITTGQWTSLRQALEDLAQRGGGASGSPPAGVPDPVLHTAITLLTLQMTSPHERALWLRAHAKGRRYIASALGVDAAAVATILEEQERRLRPASAPMPQVAPAEPINVTARRRGAR